MPRDSRRGGHVSTGAYPVHRARAGDLHVLRGGRPWAHDVCSLSRTLCDSPIWLGVATGAAGVLYLLLRGMRY
jgi:hypothetical protein